MTMLNRTFRSRDTPPIDILIQVYLDSDPPHFHVATRPVTQAFKVWGPPARELTNQDDPSSVYKQGESNA